MAINSSVLLMAQNTPWGAAENAAIGCGHFIDAEYSWLYYDVQRTTLPLCNETTLSIKCDVM